MNSATMVRSPHPTWQLQVPEPAEKAVWIVLSLRTLRSCSRRSHCITVPGQNGPNLISPEEMSIDSIVELLCNTNGADMYCCFRIWYERRSVYNTTTPRNQRGD